MTVRACDSSAGELIADTATARRSLFGDLLHSRRRKAQT